MGTAPNQRKRTTKADLENKQLENEMEIMKLRGIIGTIAGLCSSNDLEALKRIQTLALDVLIPNGKSLSGRNSKPSSKIGL